MILKLKVYGRVQGVGYRYFIKNIALKLNISGYVKNLPDGSVEILAKSDEKNLSSFKAFVIKGNGFSRVEDIEEKILDKLENNINEFVVKY
ncbi:acylphosphatase [Tepiditoga spiralis]|uniref:acylphosphatase n=1 Tax=Tepiditoga spiralis TaxID=2108365 RepID=A0A7G1G5Z5_9BACT|nr:acylphosphatase [Tepiditoga spiralis]BBE31585.1 acylphosphatase [Tepiditoga spiralis]